MVLVDRVVPGATASAYRQGGPEVVAQRLFLPSFGVQQGILLRLNLVRGAARHF